MRVVLLSAIYGGFDAAKPLPVDHGFDNAFLVTDNPSLTCEGWNVLHSPSGGMSPRFASKLPKMQPFDFVDADIVVWLDGSFQVVAPGFKDFCVESLGQKDFATWSHPDREIRNCLYEEAEFCQDWLKYRDYPIREQVSYYEADGMPRGFGLWACGTIAWKNTIGAKEFGRKWLIENARWSIQDQISFPYLVWKHSPMFAEFDAHEYDNPYLVWHKHQGEK